MWVLVLGSLEWQKNGNPSRCFISALIKINRSSMSQKAKVACKLVLWLKIRSKTVYKENNSRTFGWYVYTWIWKSRECDIHFFSVYFCHHDSRTSRTRCPPTSSAQSKSNKLLFHTIFALLFFSPTDSLSMFLFVLKQVSIANWCWCWCWWSGSKVRGRTCSACLLVLIASWLRLWMPPKQVTR